MRNDTRTTLRQDLSADPHTHLLEDLASKVDATLPAALGIIVLIGLETAPEHHLAIQVEDVQGGVVAGQRNKHARQMDASHHLHNCCRCST